MGVGAGGSTGEKSTGVNGKTHSAPQVLRKWVSRFDLWPYVERFALDVERELRAELGGRPPLPCPLWSLFAWCFGPLFAANP